MTFFKQDDFKRDEKKGLKSIGGMNTVIHCHHYNFRLQRTVESSPRIDGKGIIRHAAAITYFEMLNNLKLKKNSGDSITLAQELYSFLGFGTLDFSAFKDGIVTASDSHFVEGSKCGAEKNNQKTCRVTEGYIEAAFKAILNKDVSVEESQCLNEDCSGESCKFKVTILATPKYDFVIKRDLEFSLTYDHQSLDVKSNIDKEKIIAAVINMPLEGNNEGLIPVFNVYLAHTPQEFYNLVSINFIKEMENLNLQQVAQEMLVEDAENCALNTFGGILDSEEWRALIHPMVKNDNDIIHGLIAVSNALGWGRINITEHTPYKTLTLESSNGYEAYGYIEFEKYSTQPQCYMLKGVASGLMGLVYEKGDLGERAGKYHSKESCCLAKKDKICRFIVEVEE